MEYLLGKGEVLAFEASGAIEAITVTAGRIWLTRSGDTRDYCLEAGDRLPVQKAGQLIVEALQPATVTIICRESRADLRITMAWTRQCLTR